MLLVNQMIVQTTSFLNQFGSTVEKKISKVSAKVTQLEIQLAVLEAKIHSIPEVEEKDMQARAPAPAPAPAPPSLCTGRTEYCQFLLLLHRHHLRCWRCA